MNEIETDIDRLIDTLRSYGRVAIALSGGVDSSVVAKASQLALGDRSVAITARSPSVPEAEIDAARHVAASIGIRHHLVDTNEFASADYMRNDGTRCYHCKSELYGRIEELRDALGFDVLCSGANVDDWGDYRPGLIAAAEHHVRHPLQEAGFTKEMIRQAARYWDLPNRDKPASPCLSSRIAVGVEVTPERTRRIELAESALHRLGMRDCRVRYHEGDVARLEVEPADWPRFADEVFRTGLAEELRSLGFKFVSIDLEPLRSGSLNVLISPDVLKRGIARDGGGQM